MECPTVIKNNKSDRDLLSSEHISNKLKNLTSTCFNFQEGIPALCRLLQLSKTVKDFEDFFTSVLKLYQSYYNNSSNLKPFREQYYDEQRVSTLCYRDVDFYKDESDKLRSLSKSHGCIPEQHSRCDEITSVEPAVECPSNAASRDRCVAHTVKHTEAIHVRNSATCTCPVSAKDSPPGEECASPIANADLTTPVCDAPFDTKSTESLSTGEGSGLDNSCSSEVLVGELADISLTTVGSAQNIDTFTDTVQSSPACQTAVRSKTLDEQTASQRVYAENGTAVRSPGCPEKEAGDSIYESKDILLEMFEEEKVHVSTHILSFNATAVDCGRPVRQESSSNLGNVIAATIDKAVIAKTVFHDSIPEILRENEFHCKSAFDEVLMTKAFLIFSVCTVNQHAENSVLSRRSDQKDDGENVETERRTVSFGAGASKSTLERWNGGLKMENPSISKETQRAAILILEENQTDLEGATSRSDSASTVSLVVTTKKQGARSCTTSLDKDETTQKTDFRVCTEVSSISRKILDVLACNVEGQADLQFNKTHFEGPAASVVIHAYPLLLQDLALGPRSELWRLCTFSIVRDLPVSPIRLARSGFYYALNLDVIQCFSCGARKRHWDNSEQDVGRFHFPECNHAHLCDTTNAPLDKPVAAPHDSSGRNVHVDIQHDGGDAQHGSVFLQTGQTVPSREPATAPAPLSNERSGPAESRSSAAGKLSLPAPAEDPGLVARHREFAAQSAGTAVPVSSICPLIGDSGVAFASNETVDGVNAASSAYMKQSPTVAYVTNTTSQVPTVTGSGRDHYVYYRYSVQATHQSSVAQTHDQPNIGPASTRRPSSPLHEELGEEGRRVDAVLIQLDMTRAASRVNATARDRLASFLGWPTSSGQTPRTLALAGFYYLGSGDSVRCWYCGIILRNWRPFDDPWVTHVRFRFSCDFVIAVRGQNFVTQALVSRGHENASQSSAEFPPSSGFTDGFGAIQAAAILQDQVRSARSWEESGSTFGGQIGLSQPANNNPSNASNNASYTSSNNANNTISNSAVSSSVGSNNNYISRSSDCIQGPVSERKASRQSPSGSAANSQQGAAQDLEAVTASSSNVGKSERKTSHEKGIASRRENPPEVPGTYSGSPRNTCTGSETASRKDGSGDSGREASAQQDARNSRGRDHGNDVGKDVGKVTSLPKGPDDQSTVGAATETSSHAGQFATGTDSSSVAALSRDSSPRRPDSAHGKSHGKLFSRWKRGKSKNHKKIIQQAASTAEDNSQLNRPSSQIHDTQSRGIGGTGSSGKRDVNVNKKEQEMKPSEEKENTTSHAENESSVHGQSGRNNSHMETAFSESHTSSHHTGSIISHIEIASNERQTSSPYTESSTSHLTSSPYTDSNTSHLTSSPYTDSNTNHLTSSPYTDSNTSHLTSSPYTESNTSHLTNASFRRQAANHQTGRASHVEYVPRERITTSNHASQMLQVDSEAHDSVQGTSSKERTLSRGPDITSSATETRETSQRQSSTVPEPSGCRPVSEPTLLYNMDPADRDALYRRLHEENQRLRARRTCRICRRQTVDTIFLPCGHICSCETCASTVRECCLCFQRIRGTAHVYLE